MDREIVFKDFKTFMQIIAANDKFVFKISSQPSNKKYILAGGSDYSNSKVYMLM